MFKQLIEEILDTGLTEGDIGQRVGASQASINRIKSGSQNPKYELGAALIAFHKAIVNSVPATPPPENDSCAGFVGFGEPRGGDRRQDDRRQDCDGEQPCEQVA